MMFGTYVASQSVMVERSSILPNIEALYVNSPVPPCDCRRKCTKNHAHFAYILLQKILKKDHVQCIFANFIA